MTETNSNATYYDKAVAYWNSLGDYQYFVWIIVVIVLLVLIVLVISVRNSRARSKELEEENALEREQMEQAQKMIEQNLRYLRNFLISWILVGLVVIRFAENVAYTAKTPDPVLLHAYEHQTLHTNKVTAVEKEIIALTIPAQGTVAAQTFTAADATKGSLEKQFITAIKAECDSYDAIVGKNSDYLVTWKDQGKLSDLKYLTKYGKSIDEAFTTMQTEIDKHVPSQTAPAPHDAQDVKDEYATATKLAALKPAVTAMQTSIKAVSTDLAIKLTDSQIQACKTKATGLYAPSVAENVAGKPDYLLVNEGLYTWNPFQSTSAFLREIVGLVFSPSVGIERLAGLLYDYYAEYASYAVITQ